MQYTIKTENNLHKLNYSIDNVNLRTVEQYHVLHT